MTSLYGCYYSSTFTAFEPKPSFYMQYRSTRSTNKLLVRKGYSYHVPPRIMVICSLTSSRQCSQRRESEREVAKEKQRYSGDEEVGIVAVEPRPNKGVASKVMDCVEKLIVKFMHRSSTPNFYFSGNFAPLPHETPPTTDLLVKGFLPVSPLYFAYTPHSWNYWFGLHAATVFIFGIRAKTPPLVFKKSPNHQVTSSAN